MPRTYKPQDQARRFAASEQALKEQGGRRINVRLRPEAARKLGALVEKYGDQTSAVNAALLKAR